MLGQNLHATFSEFVGSKLVLFISGRTLKIKVIDVIQSTW